MIFRPSGERVATSVTCTVCGSHESRKWLNPRRSPGPVVRCLNCGMVFVSPLERTQAIIEDGAQFPEHDLLRCSSDLTELAGCWEMAGLDESPVMRTARRRNHNRVIDWIDNAGAPGKRLLDFGSGWGFFLESARDRGWHATGLEPLPGHGIYARGQLGLDVVTDTLRDDTFAAQSFDVVTAFQVFEHLPNPAEELRKLHRVLARDGLVLIEVPNIDTPLLRLMRASHRHFVIDHLWFFKAHTLKLLLRNCGFEPVVIRYPTRWLPVSHIVRYWFGRYLPSRLVRALDATCARTGLLHRTVPINIGDIVLAIGRKSA